MIWSHKSSLFLFSSIHNFFSIFIDLFLFFAVTILICLWRYCTVCVWSLQKFMLFYWMFLILNNSNKKWVISLVFFMDIVIWENEIYMFMSIDFFSLKETKMEISCWKLIFVVVVSVQISILKLKFTHNRNYPTKNGKISVNNVLHSKWRAKKFFTTWNQVNFWNTHSAVNTGVVIIFRIYD